MPNRNSIRNTLVVWLRMIDRCLNEESPGWKYASGMVCERWCPYIDAVAQPRFDLFLSDMGPRPGRRMLERIDTKQNYSPDNCRWSEREEDETPAAVSRDRPKKLNFISESTANARTFNIWSAMLARCSNPDNKYYGGRGITVCKRWHRFANFLADMGLAPEDHSLDRINNNKGYRPSNCRWATDEVQAKNKRPRQKQWKHPEGVPHNRNELLDLLKDSLQKRLRKR